MGTDESTPLFKNYWYDMKIILIGANPLLIWIIVLMENRVDRNQQASDNFEKIIHTVQSQIYSKLVLSGRSKRTPKIGFQYRLSVSAGQKYCRMLQGERSTILFDIH